jgi:uncharacterized protein
VEKKMQSLLSSQRIITVDALRGFALLGILMAHFIYWYSGAGLPQEMYQKYSDPGSIAASAFNGILIFGKFFTFFAFLFGLSFFLQMQSLGRREGNFTARYAWRLTILGIIGLIHHALWRGDILSIYVPLGFILLLFRNISNKIVLIIAVLLVLNIPVRLIEIIQHFANSSTANVHPPPDTEAHRYYQIIKAGSFIEMLKDNWKALESKFRFQFYSGRIYITLGFFMLGMYAGRMKWFENPESSRPIFKRICKWSGFITLSIIVFSIIIFVISNALKLKTEQSPSVQFLFTFLFDTGNSTLTIFYLSGLTMLMYRNRWQKILHPLAPIGKMALTSYVLQTFFGLLLFYAFGFGLFEKTNPWQNLLIGILVFVLQVFISRWWFKPFRYGPLEWLWRSFTFFKLQPLKKQQLEIA